VAHVELARTAVEELEDLTRTHSLPADTPARVARSLRALERFPRMGPALSGRWEGMRFLLGPWRWMILVYVFIEEEDRVVVVTVQDGRSGSAAAGARRLAASRRAIWMQRDRGGSTSMWRRSPASPAWQDSDMERVLGIGGYFIRAADPVALGTWYRDCLGLDADENGLWRQVAGPTVFATFESETDYFGARAQQAMINFRVGNLEAMLEQLRAKGADVAEETQDMEGVGRFGWVTDPEGNRIELWQPA
jgi:predicted enzyme related to lactoylglutathione lyase